MSNFRQRSVSLSQHSPARWLVLLALLLVLPSAAGAQSEVAAVLRVVYAGVEVRRANTGTWIPMRPGAEMGVGAGDAIRTDLTGRALIAFAAARALLLPDSAYTLVRSDEDGAIIVQDGRAVHQTSAAGAAYIVSGADETQIVTTGETDALFAAQVDAEAGLTLAVAATGGVSIQRGGDSAPLPINNGMRIDAQMSRPYPLTAPLRFASLEVASFPFGCDATSVPTLAPRLIARIGASEAFRSIGGVEFGAPLRIVGRTDDGQRYRIAYFSAYAWVVANGVLLAPGCDLTSLPIFPYDTLELPLGAIAVTPEELELLRPFYGTPDDDPWFYRSTDDLIPAR